MSGLFRLTDEQIKRLRPFFQKSHGMPRVDDRRVLSGIVFVNRNGLRWRDEPKAMARTRPSTIAGSGEASEACSRA
jgi:transposase